MNAERNVLIVFNASKQAFYHRSIASPHPLHEGHEPGQSSVSIRSHASYQIIFPALDAILTFL
jgi:hypothetical protein